MSLDYEFFGLVSWLLYHIVCLVMEIKSYKSHNHITSIGTTASFIEYQSSLFMTSPI